MYIGQHKGNTIKNVKKYIRQHFSKAMANYAKVLYKDIRKYGSENFKSEIVHWCYSAENMNEMEIFYIKFYKSNLLIGEHGYNCVNGGQPVKTERKDGYLEINVEFNGVNKK